MLRELQKEGLLTQDTQMVAPAILKAFGSLITPGLPLLRICGLMPLL